MNDFSDLIEPPSQDQLARLSTLAEDLIAQRRAIARAEEQVAALKAQEQALSGVTIPDLMREVGMKEFVLTDGSRISVQKVPRCSIAGEKKFPAIAWLDENGHGGLVKTSVVALLPRTKREEAQALVKELGARGLDVEETAYVHPGTLLSHLKELQKQGVPFPAETFGWHEHVVTKVEEAKKK